jgi:hypothetical protein
MDRTRFPQFLRRPQACQYLEAVWGLTFTAGTLTKLCSQKRGPETSYDGRRALHTPAALDQWARSRIKAPAARLADGADTTATPPLPPIAASAGEWRPAA